MGSEALEEMRTGGPVATCIEGCWSFGLWGPEPGEKPRDLSIPRTGEQVDLKKVKLCHNLLKETGVELPLHRVDRCSAQPVGTSVGDV